MGSNYRRAYRSEYNKPKNLHRRAAHKKCPHPKSEQPRKVQKPQQTQGRKIPAEPISNPPTAQGLTPFCRSRGGAKEPAGQSRRPSIHTLRGKYIYTWGAYVPDPRADKNTKRRIGNRNQHKRKCVAGRSSDRRPTGNATGREYMSPGGNRGGRHETPTPNPGKSHARSHDNHPSPVIRREQRPRV